MQAERSWTTCTASPAYSAAWGADPDVQLAGLCHAGYGTDGFDGSLLGITERWVLAELIGDRAEALVYLYSGMLDGWTHMK
ncbi:DUF6817 domain-containing protein [Streptomyces sp. NPDC006172]|uniref:DUF6817 domain-containing protein n=1 Tax=Streptomyces sp. NPDC006172 TaxID=3154470 RepID=UPI0033D27016